MMWVAHAGEEHVSNSESVGHLFSGDFLKIIVVSAICISIILFLAYASQPKKSSKNIKEESDE